MVAWALAALFAAAWIPVFAFRAEDVHASLPFYSTAERFWVRICPVIFALHTTLGTLLVTVNDPLPPLRSLLAAAAVVVGFALWLWARVQIMPLHMRRLPDDPPAALRRDGPFGLVRNPCYLAYLLIAAGPLLATASALLACTWAAAFVALAIRAAQEERRLHAQLGTAYADYCRTVKRLVPFVW